MEKPSALLVYLVVAASIADRGSGQVTVKGTCAAFDSKQKFSNSTFYSGSWFVIESYPNRYHGNVSCEEFSFSTDQKHVYINNTFFNSSSQSMTTISGKARILLSKGANRLVLSPGIKTCMRCCLMTVLLDWCVALYTTFYCISLTKSCKYSSWIDQCFQVPVDSYLWIVSTDYSSYAVLYVCQQLSTSAKEYVFILSRSPDLLPGIKARLIVSHIVQEDLPVSPLRTMEQENCPLQR